MSTNATTSGATMNTDHGYTSSSTCTRWRWSATPGLGLYPPIAPVRGHLFTVSPPNTGQE